MTAHVVYPALDEAYPATLSRTIVERILRRECGHRGLIVTDDLEMGAITADRTVEQAAVQALASGCDTILVCGASVERHASVLEAIIHAVEAGGLDGRRVEEAWGSSTARQGAFSGRRPVPPPPVAPADSGTDRFRRTPVGGGRDGAGLMRKPRRLLSGDRIAVVAPASPFDRSRFDRGVTEIARLGLQPVLTDGVFDRRGYVAGGGAPAGRRADGGVARSFHRRGNRGARWIWERPVAPVARLRRPRRDPPGVHRPQRSHGVTRLSHGPLRGGLLSWADGGQSGRRRRGLRFGFLPARPDDRGADGRARSRRGAGASAR